MGGFRSSLSEPESAAGIGWDCTGAVLFLNECDALLRAVDTAIEIDFRSE
jgi:hypothetical protein